MSDTNLIKKITVALAYAGGVERGIQDQSKEDLLELMTIRDVPEDDLGDVFELVDAFLGFAQNVRAAERKGKSIVPHVGEKDLPKSK